MNIYIYRYMHVYVYIYICIYSLTKRSKYLSTKHPIESPEISQNFANTSKIPSPTAPPKAC